MTRILTWVPRKYGSPLGFLVDDDREIVAVDVRRADAEVLFPDAVISYDRDGMWRRGADGRTLAQVIASAGDQR